MEPIKIVVWDNIGNTLLGVQPWEKWSPQIQERLLSEDPHAREHAPSLAQILGDQPFDLVWLYNPEKAARGFVKLFEDHTPNLRIAESAEIIAREIRDADFVVIHKERLPADALRQAERIRLLQHLGQDYRGVPIETARDMGISVAATPLVNYLAVAEHCWALILNHLKQLPAHRQHMQARKYTEQWGTIPNIRLVLDQTLGLLGFGEIARPMARVGTAFGMRVLYWDIERFPEIEHQYGVEFVEWSEIFQESDIVSVQLALNEHTHGIIGGQEIGWMKPDALFLNTARGKLVDQEALVRALERRQIGGAALDVFYEEPLPVDDPLHDLHEQIDANVTLTPHSASQGPWTWVRDSQELWYNVRRVLDGDPPHHLV